jgi:CDP-paratose 2-epimerase
MSGPVDGTREDGREDGKDEARRRVLAPAARPARPARPEGSAGRPVVITGGAGFIGTNLADRLLGQGRRVRLLDNLSRPGVERNLAWLRARYGERLGVEIADVRDAAAVRKAVRGAEAVFHFAAQVAVTTSLDDPLYDFQVNALGTLNVLEAVRQSDQGGAPPPLIFTSTNKVYGGMEDVALGCTRGRYEPADRQLAARGFSEDRPLDFHSPYGSSKGAADQYVLDYARSYGLRTVVFRMSCIYGPHQFGTEDQGWVAHFLIRALEGRPITLYGDGRQVRDVLYVGDLVRAFLLAEEHVGEIAGRAFNIGGSAAHTTSLLELVERIAALHGRRPEVAFEGWRTGDQRYYVSDVRRFAEATGWQPCVGLEEGLGKLYNWLLEMRGTRPRRQPEVAAVRA